MLKLVVQEKLVCRWKLQGTLVDDVTAALLPRDLTPLRWTISFGEYTLDVLGAPWPQCRLPRLVGYQDVGYLRTVRWSPMVLGSWMPDVFLSHYVPRMMLELPEGGHGISDGLISLLATVEYRVVLILAWQVMFFQLEIDCHTRFLIHNVCSGCPASVGLGGPR